MPHLPAKEKSKAIEIKDGSIRIKIYPERTSNRWCVVYRESKNGPRKRILRKTLAEAKEEARDQCTRIANGRLAADELTPQDRVEAAAAKKALAPLGLAIDAVARQVADAVRLTDGATIAELARFWARHHGAATSRKTATEIHGEMLTAKRPLGLSRVYDQQLRNDLKHFAEYFPAIPLAEIEPSQIEEYLQKREVGYVRYNKLRSLIITLFLFAKARKYLPQDRITPAERVTSLPKPRGTPPPKIFSPAEMRLLLANVDAPYQPWLALAAFAGLRKAELVRLTWEENVFWDDGVIYITERVAKRTTRKFGDVRYVPIPANLSDWLHPCRNRHGFICPGKTEGQREGGIEREQARLSGMLPGGRWGKNPIRHSWESYRAAETSNLPQTVMEAGNSTEVARNSYLNPRLKREATAWFAICPTVETWRLARDWDAGKLPERFSSYPITAGLDNVIELGKR